MRWTSRNRQVGEEGRKEGRGGGGFRRFLVRTEVSNIPMSHSRACTTAARAFRTQHQTNGDWNQRHKWLPGLLAAAGIAAHGRGVSGMHNCCMKTEPNTGRHQQSQRKGGGEIGIVIQHMEHTRDARKEAHERSRGGSCAVLAVHFRHSLSVAEHKVEQDGDQQHHATKGEKHVHHVRLLDGWGDCEAEK